jgi:hypothetical protein
VCRHDSRDNHGHIRYMNMPISWICLSIDLPTHAQSMNLSPPLSLSKHSLLFLYLSLYLAEAISAVAHAYAMNLSIYLLTEAIVAILDACINAVEAAHATSADVNKVYTDQQRSHVHQHAAKGEGVWGHMPAMVDAGLDVDIEIALDIEAALGLEIATGDVDALLVDGEQAATNYLPSTPTRAPRHPARPHVYGEVARASRECASSSDPSSRASLHMPEADIAAQASGAAYSKPPQTSPSLPIPKQSAVQGQEERAREREGRMQPIIDCTQTTNYIGAGGEGEGGKGEGDTEMWEVLGEGDEIALDIMSSVKSEPEGEKGLTLCSSWSEFAYDMSSAKAESEREIGLNSLSPLASTPVRGSTAAPTMGEGGKVEADQGGEREGDVWHIQVSRSTGKCYYYNVSCNTSSWVLPAKETILKVLANTKNELERRLMLQPYIEPDSPALLRQNALQTLFLSELHQQDEVRDVLDVENLSLEPDSEELLELEYLLDVVSSQWSLIVSFEEHGNTRHLFSKVLYVSSEFSKCTWAMTFENLCQASAALVRGARKHTLAGDTGPHLRGG